MFFGANIPDRPITIQEKLAWLQIYDTMNYLKPICADKLKVHEYVKEKLGKDICVPVLKVFEKPEDFTLGELPDNFVLKSNHASGQVMICRDKKQFDVNNAIATMKSWLSKPFGLQCFEPHYLYIERKCFTEKLLVSENHSASMTDYRLWMFNGKLGLISVNSGFGHGPITRYNSDFVFIRDWNEPSCFVFPKPKHFEQMKEYAEKLSEPFRFVRVDFYEVGDTVYLGEMTFTPGANRFTFKNPRLSVAFGNMLKL